MLHIHPNARTTPAVRAEIARSTEPSGTVTQRYDISAETVRKWRKRGVEDCLDHSARPHRLPWKATNEERTVVCALRRSTNLALDDRTFAVSYVLPHLNRGSIFRILKAEGLNRRAKPFSHRPTKGEGTFIAFLREAAAAFPFRLTHVLTDNGSCFTPASARACAALGADYRHTKPRTPQTNGRVERCNGRVGSEVLGITIYSHRDLEQLLRGCNPAYNDRRQRVLDGKTPNQVTAERFKAQPKLAGGKPEGRAGLDNVAKARVIVEDAKEVSQPDTLADELETCDEAWRSVAQE